MNYLLPNEYLLIWNYLNYLPKRIKKVHSYFKSSTKKNKHSFKEFILNELNFLKIIYPAFIKHTFCYFFNNNKYFLKQSDLVLLLTKYLDLDVVYTIVEKKYARKNALYNSTRCFLKTYILQKSEDFKKSEKQSHSINVSKLTQIDGYIDAINNLCELKDFGRMYKLKNLCFVSNKTIKKLDLILFDWGFYFEFQKLYLKLAENFELDKSTLHEVDYFYFDFIGSFFCNANYYQESIYYYKKAIDSIDKLYKNSKLYFKKTYYCLLKPQYYYEIGNMYFQLNDYDNADEFLKKALHYQKQNHRRRRFHIAPYWKYYSTIKGNLIPLISLSIICLIVFSILFITTTIINRGVFESQFAICYMISMVLYINTPIDISNDFHINLLFKILKNLARIYVHHNEYEIAFQYYQEAINEAKKKRIDSDIKKTIYPEYIDILLDLELNHLTNENYDLCFNLLNEAFSYTYKSNNSELLQGRIFHRYGILYLILRNHDEGINCLKKALFYFEELEDSSTTAKILNDIAMAYYELNKFDKALEYFRTAISICENNEDVITLASVKKNIKTVILYLKKLNHTTVLQEPETGM